MTERDEAISKAATSVPARRPVARTRRGLALALAAMAAWAALGGCEDSKAPLPGERIPVIMNEGTVLPDPALADVLVALPRPAPNADWAQAGGNARHVMQHLQIPDIPQRAWSADIGAGTTSERLLLPAPVIADGRIFTMDTEYRVTAFDAATGERLWATDLPNDDDQEGVGGGLAYAEGRLFATTGFAQIIALNAETGKEVWRQGVLAPIRAAPTYAGGRLYVVAVDNRLHALDAAKGKKLWTHAGTIETAGLLGGSAPAVDADIVVVPYSSGEIYALQTANGRVVWSENLGAVKRGDVASQIADIRGLPVIQDGRVYAISHAGRMVAIDLRVGRRIWDRTIGGVHSPWIAGDYIFVLTSDAHLVCANRLDGRIRWVAALQRYGDAAKKRDPIAWTGPVLAGDRLIVVGSRGDVVAVSPYTGEFLGKMTLSDPISVAPIVANETLYILTDAGELVALR